MKRKTKAKIAPVPPPRPVEEQEQQQNAIAGRQRLRWPVFDSIGQAVGVLKYTRDEILLAKEKGSKAFLSKGRIDAGILIPDLNELLHSNSELPKGFTSWKEFGERCRAQIANEDLRERKGELMSKAEARKHNAEAWEFVFAELERLCIEKPPALAGRTAVEIHEQLIEFKERTRKAAKKKFEDAA